MTACFCYYRKGKHTILPAMAAIHQGLSVHGVHVYHSLSEAPGGKSVCDFALCWGPRQDTRLRDNEHWEGPRLYAEMGYITDRKFFDDRNGYKDYRMGCVSFSWNGMHGQGDNYVPAPCPPDRLQKLGVELQPWRSNPQGVVWVLGQTETDPIAIPPGMDKAYNETLVPLVQKAFPRHRVRFRPHPRYTDFGAKPLLTEVANAHVVITYSSTAAVETLFAGIPTIVLSDRSICWPVAGHSISPSEVITPDREAWANEIAYKQWNFDELESGEFWETVKHGL